MKEEQCYYNHIRYTFQYDDMLLRSDFDTDISDEDDSSDEDGVSDEDDSSDEEAFSDIPSNQIRLMYHAYKKRCEEYRDFDAAYTCDFGKTKPISIYRFIK